MSHLNEEIAYTGPWRPASAPPVAALFQPGREDASVSLSDELIDAGVPEGAVGAVEEIVRRQIEGELRFYGISVIRGLLSRLGDTPAGEAVKQAVYGFGADKTLSEAARCVGISKQSMAERVGRLRKRLGLDVQTPPPDGTHW